MLMAIFGMYSCLLMGVIVIDRFQGLQVLKILQVLQILQVLPSIGGVSWQGFRRTKRLTALGSVQASRHRPR